VQNFAQPARCDVVDEAADAHSVRQEHMLANLDECGLHRNVEVVKRAERVRRLGADLARNFGAKVGLANALQSTVRMMHEDHFPRAQEPLRDHERPQHIARDDAARVANDVRLAAAEPEESENVDSRIHARDDRNAL